MFSKSVGISTGPSHRGMLVLAPPLGLLGLGYSLRDCSFTSDNYLSHHALGTLAERLVEKGMLAAAGGDDHRSDGGAGQQPYLLDAGAE